MRPWSIAIRCAKAASSSSAALLAAAAITAGHQQAAIGEIEKPFRLGARLEMPGDRAPAVAPHRRGAVMIAADAERHALGGAAGEFRMQQRVELHRGRRRQVRRRARGRDRQG